MAKIHLIDPDPVVEPEPGEKPTLVAITPEGATPGRETPGFFVLRIDDDWVMPEGHDAAAKQNPDTPVMPRQFLSLDAVHAYLTERFGTAPPLRPTRFAQTRTQGPKEFPVIWTGTRRKGRQRLPIQARYIGSFRYRDGRLVDPTKVGTPLEFN